MPIAPVCIHCDSLTLSAAYYCRPSLSRSVRVSLSVPPISLSLWSLSTPTQAAAGEEAIAMEDEEAAVARRVEEEAAEAAARKKRLKPIPPQVKRLSCRMGGNARAVTAWAGQTVY
jgi:hypothetical protein